MSVSDSGLEKSTAVPSVPSVAEETRVLLRIAAPLMAAYIAEMAMFVITRIVVGQLGYVELAAAGIAGHLVFELVVVLMGLLSVVGVLVANAEGSDNKAAGGHATRQGLILATVIGVPATIFAYHAGPLFIYLGQAPEVVEKVEEFLPAMTWMILPTLWFVCFRNFVTAIARTGAIMVITVSAVIMNYFLTVGLVHGEYGLPALGIAGAGWAVSIVSWYMFFALLVYVYRTPVMRGYGLFKDRLRFDYAICREIVILGIPVAGIVTLEGGLFAAVSIISGILGPVQLATYEILISCVGFAFMAALALAEASMVRVAFGMGRGRLAAARQSGIISLVIGASLMALLTVFPLTFPQEIVDVFLDRNDPGFEPVSQLAGNLFYIVAIFQIFDGTQAIATRSLRGIKDTIVPLWLAGIGYWGIGIGGGYVLTFELGYGAAGIWWGMAGGIIVTAILLVIRFLRLTRQ